jgi:uncharacterized membrane protein YagU involved in acid resistance
MLPETGRDFVATTSSNHSFQKSRALAAILWGGAIAGAFDLTFATVFYGLRGVSPIRVLQSISSGLLGSKAYDGGPATALLGIVLHFVIATGAAAVFYLLSRKATFLIEKPVLWGTLYGAAIYFFMHLVVLPLAANPRFRTTTLTVATVCDFAVHMILIGPSIALAARRFSR